MEETATQMWTIVVIGISTVFLCLIALVVMVGFFKLLFARTPKARPAAQPTERNAGSAAIVPSAAKGVDGAVIAAIVAAVSAASGVPASSLRIASIERSGFNTPVWGHADRA